MAQAFLSSFLLLISAEFKEFSTLLGYNCSAGGKS